MTTLRLRYGLIRYYGILRCLTEPHGAFYGVLPSLTVSYRVLRCILRRLTESYGAFYGILRSLTESYGVLRSLRGLQ